MKKGDRLIYGSNDKEYSIPCTYTGKWEMHLDGTELIYAVCNDGGTIKAPINMFKKVQEA